MWDFLQIIYTGYFQSLCQYKKQNTFIIDFKQ